jgi:hypothetical protein
MAWVSVKDKPPKESKDYLVFNPTSVYSHIYTATWYGHEWSNSNSFITHWMPLPSPPEAKL